MKKYVRRKRVYRKRPRVGKAIKKYVKKAVVRGEEKKLVAFSPSANSIAYYQTVLLNGLVQGTAVSNRIGSQVKMVYFNCHFSMACNASGANRLRIMLVRDTQPNGATFTADLLFQDSSNTNSQLYSPVSYINRKRFQVLRDKTYVLEMAGGSSNVPKKYLYRWSIPLKGRSTQYSMTGNTGTITDIIKGALFLVFVSDDSTNGPSVGFNPKVEFIDA